MRGEMAGEGGVVRCLVVKDGLWLRVRQWKGEKVQRTWDLPS